MTLSSEVGALECSFRANIGWMDSLQDPSEPSDPYTLLLVALDRSPEGLSGAGPFQEAVHWILQGLVPPSLAEMSRGGELRRTEAALAGHIPPTAPDSPSVVLRLGLCLTWKRLG